MRSSEINRALADIGRVQHQLVRVDDARDAGIARRSLDRRVVAGLLEHIDENLYRFASSAPSWHQRALAAVWSQGPTALLSHRAAGMLWELEGVEAAPFEVLTERWARRQRRPDVRVHETNQLLGADRTVVNGVPCTSVVRTLLDNAGVLHPFRTDQMFEDAVRKRLCTPEDVAERFIRFARRGRRGTRTMRRLLAKRVGRDVPTMSEFERRFLELLMARGFDAPRLQVPVVLDVCTVYLDFAWPERMLAAECDGLFAHGRDLRLPWDDDRQNELLLRGWLVLRFTWKQLTEEPRVVERQLREGFARRLPRSA
jgi:very-short-patch-repair endonuclease